MTTIVTLPVLELENSDSGTDPYLIDIPGWDDSTEPKLNIVRRNAGHGVFDQDPVYDDARFFSIIGRQVNPGNALAITQLRTQIFGLKNLSGNWPVTVTKPDGSSRTASVKLAGKIRWDVSVEDSVVDFEIPVMAKDPRTYGPDVIVSTGLPTSGGGIAFPITFPIDFGTPGTPGRAVTTNAGEAETYTRIDVTGGLGGGFSAVCVETGQEVRFERPIPLGSVIAVDFRTGQAIIDGQSPVSSSLTRREWWTNPPGVLRTIQFNAIGSVTGAPTLTAYTPPAYN